MTKLIEADFSVFLSESAKNLQEYLQFFYSLFELIIKNEENIIGSKFPMDIASNCEKLLKICLDFVHYNNTQMNSLRIQRIIIRMISLNLIIKKATNTVLI